MRLRDLKSCRFVHPLWHAEATEIIQNRDSLEAIVLSEFGASFKILNYQNNTCQRNVLPSTSNSRQRHKSNFDEFLKIVESSKSFPCSNFCITTATLNQVKEIIQIFEHCGKNVRQIGFCFRPSLEYKLEAEAMQKFQLLLLELLPNLKHLQVGNTPKGFYFENFSSFFETQKILRLMKSLKILKISKFSVPTKFLEFILNQAPNLVAIKSQDGKWHRDTLRLLLQYKKVSLLKDFNFCFDKTADLDLYLKLAKQGLGLQLENIFEINNICPEMEISACAKSKLAEVVAKSLKTSSLTLKRIIGLHSFKISATAGACAGFDFPQLPNLHTLELCYTNKTACRYFLNSESHRYQFNLNFSGGNFRNLKHLILNFEDEVFYFLEPSQIFSNLENSDPILSVTSLSLTPWDRNSNAITVALLPSAWLQFLSKTFPNVKNLTLCKFQASSFACALRILWKSGFKNIKVLHIGIFVDSKFGSDSQDIEKTLEQEIDMGVFGLSKGAIVSIYEGLQKCCETGEDWQAPDVERMRANASVLEFRKIQTLTVHVDAGTFKDALPYFKLSEKFLPYVLSKLNCNLEVSIK